MNSRPRPHLSTLLSVLSAVLLILSFPKTDFWFLAWVGLMPLMFALDGKSPGQAFGMAYLCGVFLFTGLFYWVCYVTVFGLAAMVLYFSLYYGLFGLGYSLFQKKNVLLKAVWLASLWTVLEYLRGHLFSGFNWGSLGLSQYRALPLIQIADVTGVYGVSFFLVLFNAAVKEYVRQRFILRVKKLPAETNRALLIMTALAGIVLAYGGFRLNEPRKSASMRVGIVQGNVPQESKWYEPAWPAIMEKYLYLTGLAAGHDPDLIIWPETSFPGILSESSLTAGDQGEKFITEERYWERLRNFVRKIRTPLLIGLVTEEDNVFYNSAVLISDGGVYKGKYDKLHLVPFGEFVPLRNVFPFLARIAPIADFTPGGEFKVFPVFPRKGGKPGRFSALVCFEDSVEQLIRGFVLNGAEFLVNMTNDAWFKDTKEPFLHLQSSVFRAVESRRGVVRSANTGVSCFVDSVGNVYNPVRKYIAEGGGRDRGTASPGNVPKLTYISGYSVASVELNDHKTFYVKYGDIFVQLCWLGFIAGLFVKRK